MAKFQPDPGDSLRLFREDFVFEEHPAMPHFAYSAEGRRAAVFRLRSPAGQRFALKVFKSAFRSSAVTQQALPADQLKALPGLQAAQRRVVLPSDSAAQLHPQLAYAVLMPWIEGQTWNDILLSLQKDRKLQPSSALCLCERVLWTLTHLEAAGLTHTDISPGNVVIQWEKRQVQLLDLEDLFSLGSQVPDVKNRGTVGYQHPSAQQQVHLHRPEGDRYASAVLAAEILVLANERFTSLATDTGFFCGHRDTREGQERYRLCSSWLHQIAPEFARAFERAWHSPSLQDCPPIAELYSALKVSSFGIAGERDLIVPFQAAAPAPSSTDPLRPSSAESASPRVLRGKKNRLAVAALAILVSGGAFLLNQSPPLGAPGIEIPASLPAPLPSGVDIARLATTYSGYLKRASGERQVLVLTIRRDTETTGFVYSLNSGESRVINRGTFDQDTRRLVIPDLGTGSVLLESSGQIILNGEGFSPSERWHLRTSK